MPTEEQLTHELMSMLVKWFHDRGLDGYEAMRVLGYTLVGVAEALDLPEKQPRV